MLYIAERLFRTCSIYCCVGENPCPILPPSSLEYGDGAIYQNRIHEKFFKTRHYWPSKNEMYVKIV